MLPLVTSFVGRRAEIAEVRRLLGASRVVTLTGPGGVGKTRLAAHVMPEVAQSFTDGAVFVGLAELRDGELLPNVVADRLGLQDRSGRTARSAVLEFLRARQVLLVLDNCEHLVDASAEFVQAVVSSCPRVVWLATSRQSLGIAAERVLPVAPLAVSGDAVSLFVDRAAAIDPEFERSTDNEADLVRIAERLDGLPLAIELAARRIRSLSPAQIAQRLDSRLTLLTEQTREGPERQQTMRATLDWSYQLCTAAEQAVWARAAVFAGPFDIDAAGYVCAEAGADVLDVIDGLLDKSVLLREDGADRVRYRMLEPLREYGQERLAAGGDEERTARRHRDFYDRLTATADADWLGPHQVEWVARLRADHANIRAALAWSIARPAEAGVALRMASRLDEYWSPVRGVIAEAKLWLDRALAVAPAEHPDRPLAVAMSALYSLWQGDLDDARQRLRTAEELAAAQNDEVLDAHITHVRAFDSMLRTKRGTAALAASAAAVFRRHGLTRRELHPLFIEGLGRAIEGDPAAGRVALRKLITLTEPAGELLYQAMAYGGLAILEVDFLGDADAAADAALQSLRIDLAIGARLGTALQVELLAWVADRQGDHRRAATLFGAATPLWNQAGANPEVVVAIPHRMHLDATRSALGDAEFDAAFDDGQAMSADEAIHYALGDDKTAVVGAAPRNPLTGRELEIADLVGDGLTNREIAEKLVISKRTAETHVQHILTKLGFTNRAQIATWIIGSRS